MDYDDQDDQHLHRRENFVDYDIILDHHIIKGATRKPVDRCSRGGLPLARLERLLGIGWEQSPIKSCVHV